MEVNIELIDRLDHINDVIFLSFLMDIEIESLYLVKVDDWIKCPVEMVEDLLGFDSMKQHRILKRLAARSIIQVTRAGKPPFRWIKINYNEILHHTKQASVRGKHKKWLRKDLDNQ